MNWKLNNLYNSLGMSQRQLYRFHLSSNISIIIWFDILPMLETGHSNSIIGYMERTDQLNQLSCNNYDKNFMCLAPMIQWSS